MRQAVMTSPGVIAVEATHEGTAWDYLFFKEPVTKYSPKNNFSFCLVV